MPPHRRDDLLSDLIRYTVIWIAVLVFLGGSYALQTPAGGPYTDGSGPLVWVATKQVVGLNTLVVRGSGEEGLGFAVSSDTVREIAQRIIASAAGR